MAITISGSGITSANIADGTIVNADVADVAASKLTGALPAIDGSALTGLASANQPQVQTHLITTSSQAISANVVTNISGLNATITPTTTSKRIKVTVRWAGEGSHANNYHSVWGLKRNTVAIGNPSAAGNRKIGITMISQGFYAADAASTPDTMNFTYIDSPSSTSALTYYATFESTTAQTLYNQRCVSDADNNGIEHLTSTIILEEID